MATRRPPRKRGHGRAARKLAKYVITRDAGICWRCGHPGANTAGHILPVNTHPWLAYDPANVRAEHGTRRTIAVHGYECIGNYAARDNPPPSAPNRSRAW